MQFATGPSPHLPRPNSVHRVMQRVLIALVPGIVVLTVVMGIGVISNLVLCTVSALLLEAASLWLRGRPVRTHINDLSAVVTAWLLAIALPPLSPWWLILIGNGFAIVVAKQLYGGLGYNPFNPAMVGYVVVLIAFPLELTSWVAPIGLGATDITLWQSLQAIAGSGVASLDGVTAATPLDVAKTELSRGRTLSEIRDGAAFGLVGGHGLEWVNLAFLGGGLWLLWKQVIQWQIPVSMLASLAVVAGLFWMVDPGTHPTPLFHLATGAAILGAFFIATDPVSAATTPTGRIVFGAGIGVLTYVIRTWGGYPDGVAFAVLLMNLVAPTIDYYTQPRVFGHERRP